MEFSTSSNAWQVTRSDIFSQQLRALTLWITLEMEVLFIILRKTTCKYKYMPLVNYLTTPPPLFSLFPHCRSQSQYKKDQPFLLILFNTSKIVMMASCFRIIFSRQWKRQQKNKLDLAVVYVSLHKSYFSIQVFQSW